MTCETAPCTQSPLGGGLQLPPVHSSGAGAPEGLSGNWSADPGRSPHEPECQVRGGRGALPLVMGQPQPHTQALPWSTAGAMGRLLGSQGQGLVGHPVPGAGWTPCASPHHLSAQHPQKHKAGPSLGWDMPHSPPASLQGKAGAMLGGGGSVRQGPCPPSAAPPLG